jgi:nucleotide-binding universal stress UspA family protein
MNWTDAREIRLIGRTGVWLALLFAPVALRGEPSDRLATAAKDDPWKRSIDLVRRGEFDAATDAVEHVVDGGPVSDKLRAWLTEYQAKQRARKEMDRFLSGLDAAVKKSSVVVSTNKSVPQMICDEADDSGVDWIVMSTHGRTGLDHFVMGSVAERVVQNASCPVLTVRWHKFRDRKAEKEAA